MNEKLFLCPTCNKEIAKKAKSCPYCGETINSIIKDFNSKVKSLNYKKIISIFSILIFLSLLAFIGIFPGTKVYYFGKDGLMKSVWGLKEPKVYDYISEKKKYIFKINKMDFIDRIFIFVSPKPSGYGEWKKFDPSLGVLEGYVGNIKWGSEDGYGNHYVYGNWSEGREIIRSYQGQWSNGMRHGYGFSEIKDVSIFEGEWNFNMKLKGKYTKNGIMFDGEWEDYSLIDHLLKKNIPVPLSGKLFNSKKKLFGKIENRILVDINNNNMQKVLQFENKKITSCWGNNNLKGDYTVGNELLFIEDYIKLDKNKNIIGGKVFNMLSSFSRISSLEFKIVLEDYIKDCIRKLKSGEVDMIPIFSKRTCEAMRFYKKLGLKEHTIFFSRGNNDDCDWTTTDILVSKKSFLLNAPHIGFLGVQLQDVTQDLAKTFQLENAQGSFIAGVIEDTPAQKGGIRKGDVVLRINEKLILDADHLTKEIANAGAFNDVEMGIIRDGESINIKLELGGIQPFYKLYNIFFKFDKILSNSSGYFR